MKFILIKSSRSLGITLAFLFGLTGNAFAAEPLVDAAWAKANAGKPGIVFIDFQPPADFMRGHIAGSVNSNYGKDGWREESANKVPDMLPAKLDGLAAMIGKLGIDNRACVRWVLGDWHQCGNALAVNAAGCRWLTID